MRTVFVAGLTALAIVVVQPAIVNAQQGIPVSWGASTDNVGVVAYVLERCQGENCDTFSPIATTPSTQYTDEEALPELTYRYRARAKDAAGNLSPYSNIATHASSNSSAHPVLNPLTSSPPGLSQTTVPVAGQQLVLTLSGSNFGAASQVFLGDVPLATTLVDSSRLTAVVPETALVDAGSFAVKVSNSGMDSNALPFHVVQSGDINGDGRVTIGDALTTALAVGGMNMVPLAVPAGDINLNGTTDIGDALALALFADQLTPNLTTPKIVSISPNPAQKGEWITLSGSGFSPTPANNVILFTTAGNSVRRILLSDMPGATVGPTFMTLQVPMDVVSGTIQVFRVDIPLGSPEFPSLVAGTATPLTLTSVEPYYWASPGSSIVLSGLGFSADPAQNVVSFHSASGTVPGTVTAASPTSLTVTVPANAGCGDVSVSVGAVRSNARAIVVTGATCSLSLAGALGTGATGTIVVLEGTGFDRLTPGNNVVTFTTADGTAGGTVVRAGATQLQVRVPSGALPGDVTVTVGSQQSVTALTH